MPPCSLNQFNLIPLELSNRWQLSIWKLKVSWSPVERRKPGPTLATNCSSSPNTKKTRVASPNGSISFTWPFWSPALMLTCSLRIPRTTFLANVFFLGRKVIFAKKHWQLPCRLACDRFRKVSHHLPLTLVRTLQVCDATNPTRHCQRTLPVSSILE